ncbi:MAG TPA: asparagine synthase (glutamine-hydrolyzing) [Frankiaceae bacterium]|nr:asparagine synthase (glutamine-hydrolyzing) [Frankiaceae bacterium]
MCGIVGQVCVRENSVGKNCTPDPELGRRMQARLIHRGPDDAGEKLLPHAWLGHRRLSIVDVSGGKQPLHTADEQVFLVGNGEIYNFETVQAGLEGPWLTKSDNEVALHLVQQKGPDALKEMEGMFAVLIAGIDGSFLAARDPVGIKPLFWACRDDMVLFASEMHAFDLDWQADVELFPPGHYWTPATGLVRFASAVRTTGNAAKALDAWTVDEIGATPPPEGVLAEIRDRFILSVEEQMLGDVPVGVFLSGGLDSSLVAAVAARWCQRRGQTLQTFAVGTEGSSDILAARAVAEFLGTEHREHVYTAEEAWDVLPGVVSSIESFDPSLVRSAVANYLLAEFTSRHVKVVLTGEGADELFAGYAYYEEYRDEGALHDELVRSVEGLHSLNLQRCDRVTMAHGLEARVPFLDTHMIELGLALPETAKLAGNDKPEKYLLRMAFDGWVPEDVLWRGKIQFGDGSGASEVIKQRAEESVTDEEFAEICAEVEPPLRTKEEAAYYRMFRTCLPAVRPEKTISRFATA